ncbi:MAG: M1 family metallopeptidase [Bacteroidetes bacterium]|nr:M1 family metallopeptidase [Bacteroidota bacterium]
MRIFIYSIFLLLSLCPCVLVAQNENGAYTHDDTLRGAITPERAWWDLCFYQLDVNVDVEKRSLSGSNQIDYIVLQAAQVMQIDLQAPLSIDNVIQDGKNLTFKKAGQNAWLVYLSKKQEKGNRERVQVYYHGIPREAKNAPWDGGFSWAKDKKGNPFVATSCQGLGASVWWPCKDHMYDEPDSMCIRVTVPKNLMDVSNGRLRKEETHPDGSKTFEWFVQNPINNYGVNVNIADYAHFDDTLQGEKGVLSLNYYVLPANLEKAKKQFQQVKMMLRAFEYWFGPYPFYEDGYKLVEVPYLGMEHQSSVTYGNRYTNGYLGSDLSGSGWGRKWDFIIVHESGHEWFANNITYKDIADMWLHESFTCYSECLYTEFYFGKAAGAEYMTGLRKLIENKTPMIPDYNVNKEGPIDIYFKGGNLLHMIRQIVNDDAKWRAILRGINREFYHQTVTTAQIEQYISKNAGRDLSKVFDQYLRHTEIPELEYSLKRGKLKYRWKNCIPGFDMPVKVSFDNQPMQFIFPETEWKREKVNGKHLEVDPNFYIGQAR